MPKLGRNGPTDKFSMRLLEKAIKDVGTSEEPFPNLRKGTAKRTRLKGIELRAVSVSVMKKVFE